MSKIVVSKSALVEHMASESGISKAAAGRALQAVIDKTTETIKAGGSVQLIGFGTFTARQRAARTGTNPKTKEKIKIAAHKAPAFVAGSALKAAVR